MNTRLLRRVAKHISAEPKRLRMAMIASSVDPSGKDSPPCGTVGCIAGWACLLSGASADEATWGKGQDLLGLDFDESFRLFDFPAGGTDDGWPKEFNEQYIKAKTRSAKVNVAVARIEHFIKTKGKE